MQLPRIIQGGMGAAVSSWRLARAVAREGQLGVVSGTALDVVLARRLQDGDLEGHVRRALAQFPVPAVATRILERYFLPEGRPAGRPYRTVPRFRIPIPLGLQELTVAAAFVEVYLAKEGHDGPVGINFLEKIQLPNLPSLYGAMLAGVVCILMGAGIPREIPGVLDALATHQPVSITLHVDGARPGEEFRIPFDPRDVFPGDHPPLERPMFLPIIASNILAQTLARKATGRVDGFVVEDPTAGGHNAPPRGALTLDEAGEPVYGPRDVVDIPKLAELGLPFWLAGSRASAAKLREALDLGAAGVQVGTAFALCRESGLAPEVRKKLLALAARGEAHVFTDPLASPTGFPFKVASLAGTLSEESVYSERTRVCDLGFLRQAYRRESGDVGYRCASEPVEVYVRKGGAESDTRGRKCLCNGLLANVGIPQLRPSGPELPLVTTGNSINEAATFLGGRDDYSAADVICTLLA